MYAIIKEFALCTFAINWRHFHLPTSELDKENDFLKMLKTENTDNTLSRLRRLSVWAFVRFVQTDKRRHFLSNANLKFA